jgi:hypothetical protein
VTAMVARHGTPLHTAVWRTAKQERARLIDVAGIDVDASDNEGITATHSHCLRKGPCQRARFVRRRLARKSNRTLARQRVLKVQLSFVRKRAFEVCIAFQSLDLDARFSAFAIRREILQLQSVSFHFHFSYFHFKFKFSFQCSHLDDRLENGYEKKKTILLLAPHTKKERTEE